MQGASRCKPGLAEFQAVARVPDQLAPKPLRGSLKGSLAASNAGKHPPIAAGDRWQLSGYQFQLCRFLSTRSICGPSRDMAHECLASQLYFRIKHLHETMVKLDMATRAARAR